MKKFRFLQCFLLAEVIKKKDVSTEWLINCPNILFTKRMVSTYLLTIEM